MTTSLYASSRPSDALNDEEFGMVMKQAKVIAGHAAKVPKSIVAAPIAAGPNAMRHEISISGNQLLVPLVVAFCLAGALVWSLVRYWLFAP